MPIDYQIHCHDCPYRDARHLPPETRQIRRRPLSLEVNNANVLLVFQAPGIEEWKSGKPISNSKPNSAGAKLASAFKSIGKSRTHYDITNLVQCFPGKKASTSLQNPRDNLPLMSAQRACSRWLLDDIASHNYERIVVYGAPAREAVRRLGLMGDPKFVFVPHPTASGVTISSLAQSAG